MEALNANEKFRLVTNSLSCITPFHGDSNSLTNFITRIECLIPILDTFDHNYKRLILGLIKDKICGDARRTLLINGDADTWNDLKTCLINGHGERSSIDLIIDKIRVCRCDTTIDNFYQKLNSLLCRLNNAYLLNNNNENIELASNQRIALHSFKHGLPEPVKSIIISRDPKTLKDAYEIIKSNGYLNYSYNKQNNRTHKNSFFDNYNHSNNNNSYNNNKNNTNFNHYDNNHRNNTNYNHYNNNRNNSTNNNSNYNTNNNNNYSNRNTNNSGHSRQSQNQSYQYRQQLNRPQFSNYRNPTTPNNSTHNDRAEPMDISVNENFPEENFQIDSPNNFPI